MRARSRYLDAIKREMRTARWDLSGTTPPAPLLDVTGVECGEDRRAHHHAAFTKTLSRLAGWPAGQIVLAPGASQAMVLALGAFTQPGEIVVIETPTYEPIEAAASFLGLRAIAFPRGRSLEEDLANLKSLAGRARTLILTNPNCPTGRLYTRGELIELARIFPNLIVDESYLPLTTGEVSRVPEDACSIGGLSKSMGLSGLRTGWALVPAGRVPEFESTARLLHVDMPTPSLQLGTRALEIWPRVTTDLLGMVSSNRETVLAEPKLARALADFELPRSSFFCMRIPPHAPDARTFCERLSSEASVQLRSGHYFGLHRHVRVSMLLEGNDFTLALSRLAAAY